MTRRVRLSLLALAAAFALVALLLIGPWLGPLGPLWSGT